MFYRHTIKYYINYTVHIPLHKFYIKYVYIGIFNAIILKVHFVDSFRINPMAFTVG